MTDNEKDKNGLKPTQKKMISDTWYNFLLETNMLDQLENKPRGWSWFWGLYRLYNYQGALNQPADFNLKAIRDELPAEHWLKDVDDGELDAILEKNDAVMFPLVQSLADVFKRGMGITSTIYFYDLSFDKTSDFSNLIFPLDIVFEKIKFIDDVSFNNSIFLGNAYFIKAGFPEEANFRNAVFHGETAKFSGAVFNKTADFTNATFKGYANFKGSTFSGRTIFQQATFKIHAPRFYEATLSKEITWDNVTWPEFPFIFWALWQDILRKIHPKSVDTKYANDIRENQNAYETLAYQMEELGKYHDQHLFFRKEMSCRRRLENYFIRSFYWLYEIFADYGYGIGQAFMFWFLHIFFGAIAIFIIASCAGLGTQQAFFCSASTSFANANPFVFIGFKEGGLTDCYKVLHYLLPIEFGTIRGVQTFFGIPLLFILLATLRVRFRLK